jgi:hypothetical protein
MSRILINNHAECSDYEAMQAVLAVIQESKVDNNGKLYYPCLTFKYPKVVVYHKLLNNGYGFSVIDNTD